MFNVEVLLQCCGPGQQFVLSEVNFSPGSEEITKGARKNLDVMAKQIVQINDLIEVSVVGHTDKTPLGRSGKYPNNFALSSARAGSVAQILINGGVDERFVKVSGAGSTQPLFPEKDKNGKIILKNRNKNRRVHVIIKLRRD